MIKLLIIADDLTGAIDSGVHFATKGIKTKVFPDSSYYLPLDQLDKSVEVIVINTESRHISAREAAERVSRATRTGLKAGVNIIYKKTDSTLRGNIGAELEALMEVTEKDKIPFIPAYPALKRFTRNGYHYVGEELLHRTRFAEDPLEPILSSYIPEILEQQTKCSLSLVSLPYDKHRISFINNLKEILVFNCSTERDLADIGNFLTEKNLLSLVAGSAGFAPILAKKISFSIGKKERIRMSGSCLFVNGSLNPVTLEQVRFLEESSIEHVYLQPDLLNSVEGNSGYLLNLARDLKTKKQKGRDILVNSITSREDLHLYLQHKYGAFIPKEVHADAARRFGQFIAGILTEENFGILVAVGGDTLISLIRELQIEIILPITEIFPGVVLSKIMVLDQSMYLITKPGGYGERDILLRIFQYIKSKNNDRNNFR